MDSDQKISELSMDFDVYQPTVAGPWERGFRLPVEDDGECTSGCGQGSLVQTPVLHLGTPALDSYSRRDRDGSVWSSRVWPQTPRKRERKLDRESVLNHLCSIQEELEQLINSLR